jgi:hypothetical protein
VAALALTSAGCIVAMTPHVASISGRLTGPDGKAIPDATLRSKTSVERELFRTTGAVIDISDAKPDEDGRFTFPAVAMLDVIPPPWIEAAGTSDTSYELHLPGRPEMKGNIFELPKLARDAGATLDLSGRSRDLYFVPTLGGTLGAGQTISGHLGGALIVELTEISEIVGGGLHAHVDAGNQDFGATAGLLFVPVFLTMPCIAFELNARYLRAWRPDVAHRPASGPEVAVDLFNLRLSLSALAADASTSLGARSYFLGIGLGYF